jgi:hypothetical protein
MLVHLNAVICQQIWATPIVTGGHVTPSEVSLGCSLGHPRPIIIDIHVQAEYPLQYHQIIQRHTLEVCRDHVLVL